MRWGSITALSLINVLLWTGVLALSLAPRWPQFLPLLASAPPGAIAPSVASVDHSPVADRDTALNTAVVSVIDPPVPATSEGHLARAGESAGGFGGQPARPKAYSSVDTQTLVEARLREEVLAGRRGPATDSPLLPVLPENNAAGTSPVSTDDLGSRARDRGAESSAPRVDISQPSLPASAVPLAQRARTDGMTRHSRTPSATEARDRRTVSQATNPRISTPRTNLAQTPTGRARDTPGVPPSPLPRPNPGLDPHRETSAPDASIGVGSSGVMTASARREPAVTASVQSRVADVRVASPGPSQDEAQLDERWNHRERWLRERLQHR